MIDNLHSTTATDQSKPAPVYTPEMTCHYTKSRLLEAGLNLVLALYDGFHLKCIDSVRSKVDQSKREDRP